VYEGKRLTGVIKEKEQAKKEYKEHKEKGDTVAYAEVDEDNPDIMKTQIGNLLPGTEIEIVFTYLELCEVSMSKFWKFTLYSTLTPRYHMKKVPKDTDKPEDEEEKEQEGLQLPQQVSPDKGPEWKISVEIHSPSKLTHVESGSHPVDVELLNENMMAKVKLSKEFVPDRDFTLYFRNEEINKPQCILQESTTEQKID